MTFDRREGAVDLILLNENGGRRRWSCEWQGGGEMGAIGGAGGVRCRRGGLS